MCGIAGIVGDAPALDGEAMLAAIAHRGPDQQGSARPAPDVWLGATRLAIRDLSAAGDQPMTTADGALTVVHNGEIYNAARLREELEARGHRFRSRCDTEVLLHGYRAWGEQLVEHIDGMWAFALWDGPRRRLVLGRDALGVKPLWLARGPGWLAFASEVRALAAARAARWSLAPAAVASFLATGSVAEPRAILDGVEALPPGRLLVREGGAERTVRWFTLPPEQPEVPGLDEERRFAKEVRARLEASVAGCLESDVPVALLLSGGIDSSALAVLASAHRERLRTFHVRVGEAEARRAAALAARLGLRHEEVRTEATPDLLPRALAAQDQPSVDGANTFLIAGAIHAAGFKVALSGLGADEIFLGYPLHRSYVRARALGRSALWPLLSSTMWRGAARGAARALSSRAMGGLWRAEKLAEVAASSSGSSEALHASLRALFPEATRELLLGRRREAAQAETDSAESAESPESSMEGEVSRLDLQTYLVSTLLRDADVMSMAHGVELRVPMLDRALVEAVLRHGARHAFGHAPGRDRKKPLLVEAVPEIRELARAPKEGFELPLERWLSGPGPLGRSVEEVLCSPSAARRVGLEARAVERVWRRFQHRPDRPSAHRAWALHALLVWAELHGASA